ncbi:MAG: SPFH domain-containing protein [Anaerolineales bacterium]|nr:SPFH domain-containing protein [Anaerolineales bacterium]
MARIFDVIEYPNEMKDELIHRFPEGTSGDFRIGSQVIVRESQSAVFFRDGKALDTFGPGRHTITTANIPLLIGVIEKAFSGQTPFTAEVYFVSRREFPDQKWGTPQPIIVKNPGMGLGVALLKGFGTYGYQIAEPQQFVNQLVGAQGVFRTEDIENRLRDILLTILTDLLGETARKKDVTDLTGLVSELSAAVRSKASESFEGLGLDLKTFLIASLRPSEKSVKELRDMGVLDTETYTRLQAADALLEAAQNPSGGAGLTAGIGAGMGVGNIINRSLQDMGGSGGQTAGGGGMPEVMSPREAAEFLKVAEEDVVAAIEAGELKGKKIGQAYRISREALKAFLNE